MTNTQGDPQAALLLKLLHELKSPSVRMDVGKFTTLLRGVNWLWEMSKGFAERIGHAVPKMEVTVGPVFTCGRELLRG
jgi:hypothetical protein